MNISPASAHDLQGIKELLNTCDQLSNNLNGAHTELFFVIKDAGHITGSMGLEICGNFELFRSFTLRKLLFGQRFGQKLINQIKGNDHSYEIRKVNLLTTTAESFFRHNGYGMIACHNTSKFVQRTTEFQLVRAQIAKRM
jgi:amino-acid N-acetyltransferase